MTEKETKSRRGGKRPGAGRKKKGYQPAVAIADIDLKAMLAAPVPDNIDEVAQKHGRGAVDSLVKQLIHGQSEAAKVNAANAILDRGYGKPSTDAASMQMTLFGAGIGVEAARGLRDYARSFANLAIEMLHKIAAGGESEAARVSAAKSLLDRGVGTVALASVPDSMAARTIGKKEEAAQAARNIGLGRYATPAPPKLVETIQ